MDKLLRDAGNDRAAVKKALSIPKEACNEPLIRIDVANPLLHNARMPSGFESGANDLFRWSGYTKGPPEVTLNPIPADDLIVTPLSLN